MPVASSLQKMLKAPALLLPMGQVRTGPLLQGLAGHSSLPGLPPAEAPAASCRRRAEPPLLLPAPPAPPRRPATRPTWPTSAFAA